jgi:hypothetical protein
MNCAKAQEMAKKISVSRDAGRTPIKAAKL